jgi:hypothetical protein
MGQTGHRLSIAIPALNEQAAMGGEEPWYDTLSSFSLSW